MTVTTQPSVLVSCLDPPSSCRGERVSPILGPAEVPKPCNCEKFVNNEFHNITLSSMIEVLVLASVLFQ